MNLSTAFQLAHQWAHPPESFRFPSGKERIAMKANSRFFTQRVVTTILALGVLAAPTAASTSRQMTFEEVAPAADVIALAQVVSVPELGEYDAQRHEVIKRNVVRVEQYLKGKGPPQIVVETLGGLFRMPGGASPEIQEMAYGGEPTLPSPGSRVLLFLKRFSGGAEFIIYTATHGVIRLEQRQPGAPTCAGVAFRDPRFMTPGALVAYRELVASGYTGSSQVFTDCVSTTDLPQLLEKVLHGAR